VAPEPRGDGNNLHLGWFCGPNVVATELLIPAGYLTTVYDPVFALSPDRTRYISPPACGPIR